MMSISSLFLCRVGGRAGDDDVDAKGLSGAVLGADDVGADNVGAEKVGAALDADEVDADLGAEDVGGDLSALKKLLTAFLFPFHTSISCSYASSSL
jgi:hypothetical protein